ncbi:unnamed protein product [Ciceribacter selenitireducens ATCC BAA-1503]|uniref:Uncharacterized protein n=1 Tax=Ciceribacter selenitireducens ATCC BAA-1503 TaxID=1336235 RepID=A0A376AFA9_9HYPH|nr:unnamed protein product [Ciceribacter selenitireducens ATCC BAA-1503]
METCLVEILSSSRSGRGHSRDMPYASGRSGDGAVRMEVK